MFPVKEKVAAGGAAVFGFEGWVWAGKKIEGGGFFLAKLRGFWVGFF